MKSNEFTLINMTGGTGGTFRIQNGQLSARAIMALKDAPYLGWNIDGPAAYEAWRIWEQHLEAEYDE